MVQPDESDKAIRQVSYVTNEVKMKAFTNTIETKKEAVANARRHRKLDMLVQGTYESTTGKRFKGCSVGCTYKPYQGKIEAPSLHALSEPVHGIPRRLTYLRDRIFERLSVEDSKNWHVDFTDSINVGADLSMVIDKWMYWLLTDKQGLVKHATGNTLISINVVAGLYKRKLSGDSPKIEEWRKARSAAAYAAAYAAYAYADAYADAAAAAAYAAYADADADAYADADADAAAAAAAADAYADAYAAAAAAYAADDAADDAAYADAYAAAAADDAARMKFFKECVTKLLKIIKETK